MSVTISATKKITKATFKSFIKQNHDKLYVKHCSQFDGMVDCVMPIEGYFHRINPTTEHMEHSFGIAGLWLVGGRDYFSFYEDSNYIGINVYNCCGESIIAIKK